MRERHYMPNDIAAALKSSGLRADYNARPAYQRNDYIGWINRAKTSETRIKRLEQMLTELAQGGIYMGMEHKASRK
ncbi:YdeI/OmpD-associated family protein [Rothia aeria]|uniref:YdeI/OmpD-associated family protein n=1 Tax=Rothia aeria TaxID=172042 RepID=UPI0028D24731|nr:YdeI/OmpD-associated family protein [Rothia aeria]